jgi:hypothetical protein
MAGYLKMKKKQEMRILALIVGLITVAAIVFSQLFYFQDTVQAKFKKETKTEQKESGKEEAFISLPSTSLPSSSTVVLQLEVFCLFEISSDNEEASKSSFDITTPVVQLFQSLVGAVISPNAP